MLFALYINVLNLAAHSYGTPWRAGLPGRVAVAAIAARQPMRGYKHLRVDTRTFTRRSGCRGSS